MNCSASKQIKTIHLQLIYPLELFLDNYNK